MRKVLFTLVALCGMMLCPTSSAQVKFGVVGGWNVSKISYSDIQGTAKSRSGWYIGPKAEIMLPIMGLGVDVAAEYSQRKLNAEDNNKTYRSVEIPLNLRYQIGVSLAKIYIMTGPQFGFQIGSKNWDINNPAAPAAQETFKLKKSNISWNVGAGVQLFSHLEAGVGYNFALSKYAKLQNGDGSIKANTWQIQVAYLF